MAVTTSGTAESIQEAIQMYIRIEAQKLIDAEVEEAAKRVADGMRGLADKTALRLIQNYDIFRDGTDIVIRVRKEPA